MYIYDRNASLSLENFSQFKRFLKTKIDIKKKIYEYAYIIIYANAIFSIELKKNNFKNFSFLSERSIFYFFFEFRTYIYCQRKSEEKLTFNSKKIK